MIVARGYGISQVKGSIVSYGYGKSISEIITEGYHVVREFLLRITQKYEVDIER